MIETNREKKIIRSDRSKINIQIIVFVIIKIEAVAVKEIDNKQ
jgi:hypothetical protein